MHLPRDDTAVITRAMVLARRRLLPCVSWRRRARSSIAWSGVAARASSLANVCLVLNTAAVEVIPTNDLPPSTTP
jgi:hypothetical protein